MPEGNPTTTEVLSSEAILALIKNSPKNDVDSGIYLKKEFPPSKFEKIPKNPLFKENLYKEELSNLTDADIAAILERLSDILNARNLNPNKEASSPDNSNPDSSQP